MRFTEDVLKIFEEERHQTKFLTCISSLLELRLKSGPYLKLGFSASKKIVLLASLKFL